MNITKRLALISAVSLAVFAFAPFAANAAALTSTQISAIESLLQSFGASASVIANVDAALHGNPTTSSGAAGGSSTASAGPGVNTPKCLDLTYNLSQGATDATTGGQVSQLQSYLSAQGYFTAGATGYFGPATETAVQNWQASEGIVSSGSPDTTGYGAVGPSTRAAFANACTPFPLTPPPTTPQPITQPTPPPQTGSIIIQSFVVDTSNITVGQRVDFAWSSNVSPSDVTNNGGGCWIYGATTSGQFQINNGAVLPTAGALAYTPTATATYTLFCSSGAKEGSPSASKTLTVTVNAVGTTSTTIDQSSLTQSQGNSFSITGSTSASTVFVALVGVQYTGPDDYVSVSNLMKGSGAYGAVGNTASVSGGRFNAPFYNTNAGSYEVFVYDGDNAPNWTLLATGRLTVNSSTAVAAPTCTLSANPTTILQGGQSTTLVWTSTNATGAAWTEPTDENPSSPGTSGSATFTPTSIPSTSSTSVVYIVLRVSGPGGSGTCLTSVTVNTPVTNNDISLSSSPASGMAPLAVSFTATGSFSTYNINFGDGVLQGGSVSDGSCSTTACTVRHTYAAIGTYTATLTAGGKTATASIAVGS